MNAAHVLTRTFVVVIGLLFATAAHAQAIDDVWEMRGNVTLDGLLSVWDVPTGSCGAIVPNAKLGGRAKVVIYKIIAPNSGEQNLGYYVVVLQSNNQDNGSESGYAKINRLYCIKQSATKDNFVPKEPPVAGGVLSVHSSCDFHQQRSWPVAP